MRRRGVTLVEVLVAVAIMAVLVGLVLAGVQKVRAAAARTQSCNHLRQISPAVTQYADQHGGRIRNLPATNRTSFQKPNGAWAYQYVDSEIGLYMELLPWTLGFIPVSPPNPTEQQMLDAASPYVAVYLSPADPSLAGNLRGGTYESWRDATSYAPNLQVFHDTLSLPAGVPDGMSGTIAVAERYFLCHVQWWSECQNWNSVNPTFGPPPFRVGDRRPGFADPGSFDVVPVRDPNGRTVASQPGRTFQLRPTVEEADGKLLQTPHPGGLPVALFDGSVRTLSPGVAESVFWGLVTPNWGEAAGDF